MLHTVMGKRALWLKPWAADAASKKNWCKMNFDVNALFGDRLEKAISLVTGGKLGLLPQDRRMSFKSILFQVSIFEKQEFPSKQRP